MLLNNSDIHSDILFNTAFGTPKVKFNDKGEAVIQLYNNSKKTVITVEAEGITTDGKPVVWKSETDKTYSR